MRRKFVYIILLIFSFFQSTSYAQNPQWRVFTTANSPLPSNITAGIIVDRNNVKWIGTLDGMVRIEGNNWQIFDSSNTPLGTNGIYPVALDSFNNIWCVLTLKGIAKFDGINWTVYDTSNSGLPGNSNISISIDRNNVKWICTPGLIKFDDTNWTVYNTTNSGLPSNVVTSVAIENYLKWVGTFSLTGGMARFNDTNWTIYNTSNSGIPSNLIRYVSIDLYDNKWICTESSGLAKFNSILNNWTIFNTTNSNLPSNETFTINTNNTTKWIGMSSTGLVNYNDTIWNVFNASNSPLPNNFVNKITWDKFNNIWITTHGGIAIYNSDGVIGIDNKFSKLPNEFRIYQNYPNPFNPITRIEYELPNNVHITFKIYDILGREVYSVSEFKKAGIYDIKFNGSKYASGIYFYRLEVGSFAETKKMVLLK